MNTSEADSRAERGPVALRVSGLTKSFAGHRALDDVSLEVAQGEVHGLLGHNGSGKSTLIKILAGFHAPDHECRLSVCGHDLELPFASGIPGRYGISFVHQHLGLIPALTVLENMLIGRLAISNSLAINWKSERRSVRERFEAYGVSIDPGETVGDLSPVQRALVAIVRATSEIERVDGRGNGLLILDEPTPFMPQSDVVQLFRLVRRIAAQGASVIFVSHDVDEVLEITDRATVLRDGRVAARLTTKDATKEAFIEAIVGRALTLVERKREEVRVSPDGIAVSGLMGAVVDDFRLDVMPGEIVGLTGLVGSGYDEVLYLLYGAQPGSGTVTLNGSPFSVDTLTPATAMRRGVVLIPGDRLSSGAIGALSITDNVTMPTLSTVFRSFILSRTRMAEATRELIERFDVNPADPTLSLESLSGGNQQKVVLAKWLQVEPKLVLLDEPTQGVDVGARQTVFRHVNDIASRGASVLCASSDYEQLAAICHRVLIFSNGKVATTLVGDEISKDSIAESCIAAGTTESGRDSTARPSHERHIA